MLFVCVCACINELMCVCVCVCEQPIACEMWMKTKALGF